MKRFNRKWIGAVLVLGAVAVLAIWGWESVGEAASTDDAYVRGDVTSLAPKVGGYVTSVEVRDNQAVRAGQVLFRIDDRDYRAKLAQAQANVDSARARLANAVANINLQGSLVRQAQAQRQASLADLTLARSTSARRNELIGSGAVSQAQVDESTAGELRARAGEAASAASVDAQQKKIGLLETERNAAAAALAQAEAMRDLAELDLENTIVRAPISGVVGNRQVRVGRLVAAGTPLLDIVPTTNLFVIANFKETELRHIQVGQPVVITLDGYPDTPIEGIVDSFAPGSGSTFALLPADNATGNFVRVVQRVPVKIRIPRNPLAGRLVPGLSAEVEIQSRRGA
jgi:membrane fusion protein (multidrug efflux system)